MEKLKLISGGSDQLSLPELRAFVGRLVFKNCKNVFPKGVKLESRPFTIFK